MTQDKTPPHTKLDERNKIEKTLLPHQNRPDRDIIALIQDLLTGKVRVTALLNDTEVAGV